MCEDTPARTSGSADIRICGHPGIRTRGTCTNKSVYGCYAVLKVFKVLVMPARCGDGPAHPLHIPRNDPKRHYASDLASFVPVPEARVSAPAAAAAPTADPVLVTPPVDGAPGPHGPGGHGEGGQGGVAASLVVGCPDLVRQILSNLSSVDIARAEMVSSLFLREGRACRLNRNSVPTFELGATRPKLEFAPALGGQHYSRLPLPHSRHRKFPTRSALLRRVQRSRVFRPTQRSWGWLDFLYRLQFCTNGLLAYPRDAFDAADPVRSDAFSALKELAHFAREIRRDAMAIFWGVRVNRMRLDWLEGATRHWPDNIKQNILVVFRRRTRLLSYGALFVVCYMADMLRC
jgi:hypothetical protein